MPPTTQNMMPELLSPAGNWDCARAAVAAGADAIFFGLPRFNARLRADNFTEEDLPSLMEFLHEHGVKGFVTMNTLIFSDEMKAAEAQLRLIAEAGVDALIIQDLGLAKLARTVAPNVELHASTQMTITSPEGLKFLEGLFPMERAVLSRELSVDEIKRFNKSEHTPLEVFVHGALCVAYSGQCLTSESLGQRSANRGECAQACRMPYQIVVDGVMKPMKEVRYLLSPQDLAAVDLIPELIQAGVKSFKIEGRLKSPEYVTAVTRVYRKAIDEALGKSKEKVTLQDRYALEMTFSRGLSQGWLGGTNHPRLTHGRYGKKRGPLLGKIVECAPGWVRLGELTETPFAAGDGVVFDAGEDRNQEQGARIWTATGDKMNFHLEYSGLDFRRIHPGMTIYKTSDPKLDSALKKFWQNAKLTPKKIPLSMKVTGKEGECLRVSMGDIEAVSEQVLQAASKRALDTETLVEQFGRLGDTSYELKELKNEVIGDCYLPLSTLNQLRRDFIQAYDTQVVSISDSTYQAVPYSLDYRTLYADKASVTPSLQEPQLSVLCRNEEQVEAAIKAKVARVYCDFEDPRRFKQIVSYFKSNAEKDSRIFLATPRILKTGETGYLKLIEKAEPDGLLLRNLGALEYYKNRPDITKVADFSLNVSNPLTAKLLMESAGLEHLTISYDLNITQVLALLQEAPAEWFELTLHQHMPMFHMEHCVFCTFLSSGTTYKDCGRPCEKHVVHLKDRVGQLHRLQADVSCRNTLFNGMAQSGARYFDFLHRAGLQRYRVELLDENEANATKAIEVYQKLLAGQVDAFDLLDEIQVLEKLGVTEGALADNY